MVKGSAFWVNQTAFAKVVHVLEFVAIKASGDIDTFAPNRRINTFTLKATATASAKGFFSRLVRN